MEETKQPNVKVLKGKLILETNNGITEVRPFTKTHLVKFIGYYKVGDESVVSDDPYIYIYRGKITKNTIKIPGSIYKKANGDYLWIAHDPQNADKYHLSKCIEISKETILEKLNDPNLKLHQVTPALLETSDGEIFAPPIRETDDILKRVIKTTLQNMRINIKSLKSKFSNDYDLNNLKSQLVKEGAMSSKYFIRWAEILDINIEVIVTNKPGSNKLPDEVTVVMK